VRRSRELRLHIKDPALLPYLSAVAPGRTNAMSNFQQYRRKQIAELRPWEPGEDLAAVSISAPDKAAGSPKAGDMIARNPKNHADQWLVAAQYFADNFEPLPAAPAAAGEKGGRG